MQCRSRFVEAFEVTANQRGARRWEIEAPVIVTPSIPRPAPSPVRYPEEEEKLHCAEDPLEFAAAKIIPFSEVGDRAFSTCLPLVGSLAAGNPFHGIEAGSLDACEDLDWIEVPKRQAKPGRFVVRVAGDSMEPTLRIGDLVIFEYHRSSRREHEIVIANIPDFGPGSHGTETIKRITQDADNWVFVSDNPAHPVICVRKTETAHPILGTFVAMMPRTKPEGG